MPIVRQNARCGTSGPSLGRNHTAITTIGTRNSSRLQVYPWGEALG